MAKKHKGKKTRKFKWTAARRRAFAKMRAAAKARTAGVVRKAKKHHKAKKAHKKPRPVKTAGRQRLLGAACPCKRQCCGAAGVKCSCACHGRNHGGIRSNPPPSSEPKLHVHRFAGVPTALYYRRGGKTYEHAIGGGASILIPKRGDFIVIKGVRTGEYLEG